MQFISVNFHAATISRNINIITTNQNKALSQANLTQTNRSEHIFYSQFLAGRQGLILLLG